MSPIFKGPIFASHRQHYKAKQRAFTALPVARGVVNEQDFLEQRSGRPTRHNLDTIVVDECKEVTPQDIEKITELLRGRMDLQSFISTEKNSDWFWEFVKEESDDHQ